MDALNKANELIEEAYYDERGMGGLMRENAAIYAAIAQAEQLKRIADALGQWMSVQGILPEFFEAVDRAKQIVEENATKLVDPDAQDYDRYGDYNEALEDYRYRKEQAIAWAKAERAE